MGDGNLDGLFERVALEQIETGDGFLGAAHRAVGDLEPAVAAANRLRLSDGLEDMTHEPYSTVGEIRRPRLHLTGERGSVLRRQPQIRPCTDKEHEAHAFASSSTSPNTGPSANVGSSL